MVFDLCQYYIRQSPRYIGFAPRSMSDAIEVGQYQHGYILALAAAEGLGEKAPAYANAGEASFRLDNLEMAEK
jgi:hypothetical protein